MQHQWAAWLMVAALLGGCASRHPSQQNVGLIPSGERAADLRDDEFRRLGVDRAPAVPLNVPVYEIPFRAASAGFELVFVDPFNAVYKIFTHDNAETAARDMLSDSADKRRYGVLRLADEEYARAGASERRLWADMAKNDKDYAVRAAAIRALNWARDDTHTQVFIDALNDDQPLVRLEATKALANLPNYAAQAPLTDRLQHDISHDVRIAAADALRCYKTDDTAHTLIGMLDDSDFDVAWQARQSLRLMTGYDFHYDIRAWLNYLTESKRPFG